MSETKKTNYGWKFFRAGTVDQVVLASASDLKNLASLDKKLWVALACPTKGLEIEERTLELVDSDGDGRIRPPELLAAVAWTGEVLVHQDDLFKPSDSIALASIRPDTPAGSELQATAKRILASRGREDADAVTLADVAETAAAFTARPLNGDGVVTPTSSDDEVLRFAITDAIAVVGSVPDRSGGAGIDQAHLDAFVTRLRAYAAWLEQGAPVALPFSDNTPAAIGALSAVREKIDDYFVRCRLAEFDPTLGVSLSGGEARGAVLAGKVLGTEDTDVAALPLASPAPRRALPLREVNPAWRSRLAAFAELLLSSTSGAAVEALTETDWTAIKAKVASYDAWRAARPNDPEVEKLGADRILTLAGGKALDAVAALIAVDAALATEVEQMKAVEKAIRFRRDLVLLLRNFVNFGEFYGKRLGAFQVGTLYIDGRSCDLCLPVHDVAKHAALAGLSNAYLAYCDCTRKKDAEKRTIVAAVTAGDLDNLMVGRNGVFYDRKGDDWDATITKIVENPISVRQAFFAPYKRFVRLLQEQLNKRAAAAHQAANKRVEAGASAVAAAADQKKAEAEPKAGEGIAPPEAKKIDIGTVAALGVAIGGIATFFSSMLATFLGLGMWMPFGVVALVLAISGPSMLIAWLKLRQRNIGPLLDANGWAVNAFARVNVPFGGALTSVAALPPGASRTLDDPFAEKRRPWGFYFFVLLLLGLLAVWLSGKADRYLPPDFTAHRILERIGGEP